MIPHIWKCGLRLWRCLCFPRLKTLQCLVHGLGDPLPVLHALYRRQGLIVEAEVEAEGPSVPGVHPERPPDFLLRLQRPAGRPCAAAHAAAQRDACLLQPLRCSRSAGLLVSLCMPAHTAYWMPLKGQHKEIQMPHPSTHIRFDKRSQEVLHCNACQCVRVTDACKLFTRWPS